MGIRFGRGAVHGRFGNGRKSAECSRTQTEATVRIATRLPVIVAIIESMTAGAGVGFRECEAFFGTLIPLPPPQSRIQAQQRAAKRYGCHWRQWHL
jgi:hypothetical protein